MRYHATLKRFTLTQDELNRAAGSAMYALRSIKEGAGMSQSPHKRGVALVALEPCDHAMKGVIDCMAAVGVDLGGEWGNEIDTSEEW